MSKRDCCDLTGCLTGTLFSILHSSMPGVFPAPANAESKPDMLKSD